MVDKYPPSKNSYKTKLPTCPPLWDFDEYYDTDKLARVAALKDAGVVQTIPLAVMKKEIKTDGSSKFEFKDKDGFTHELKDKIKNLWPDYLQYVYQTGEDYILRDRGDKNVDKNDCKKSIKQEEDEKRTLYVVLEKHIFGHYYIDANNYERPHFHVQQCERNEDGSFKALDHGPPFCRQHYYYYENQESREEDNQLAQMLVQEEIDFIARVEIEQERRRKQQEQQPKKPQKTNK